MRVSAKLCKTSFPLLYSAFTICGRAANSISGGAPAEGGAGTKNAVRVRGVRQREGESLSGREDE